MINDALNSTLVLKLLFLILCCLLCFLLFLILCCLLCFLLYKFVKIFKNKKYLKVQQLVRETSLHYNSILSLNKNYHFHNLNTCYPYTKQVKTKTQIYQFNFDNYFEQQLEDNLSRIKQIIEYSQENRDLYAKYEHELNKIPPLASENTIKHLNVSYNLYSQIESELSNELILSPTLYPYFECYISYTSPKGRSYESLNKMYSFQDMLCHYDNVQTKIEFRNSKIGQRRKMTPSLRYDIMKRDNFRCVLCGRTVNDGIKLHVDHIIPISKGGKTIKSNLRTLCNECNLGKSDKYDETDLN